MDIDDKVEARTVGHTIGPYSDVVRIGDVLYLSGRIGIDPATGRLVNGGVAEQARQCLRNIAAVLDAVGSSAGQVLKTTVFLSNMADFSEMNAVYGDVFGDWKPARSTIAVAGLPMGAAVEIEAIATSKTITSGIEVEASCSAT